MTEAQFQAKLLKKLRLHQLLANAVVWKHTDMRNGGIPDVSITLYGSTNWFELKVAPNKPSKLQRYYLNKLGRCAHLVTYYDKLEYTDIDCEEFATFDSAVDKIAQLCMETI